MLGIDLDQRYLDFGKENGVNLINSTIEDYESKQKYDLIVVCYVLEHLKIQLIFLQVHSLFDENGQFIWKYLHWNQSKMVLMEKFTKLFSYSSHFTYRKKIRD